MLPVAGRGSRFKEHYRQPKPLIPVNGVPMVKLVIDNISPVVPHRLIVIALSEHLDNGLRDVLAGETNDVVSLDEVTAGAACTVMQAWRLIDTHDPLLIANGDQFLEDVSVDEFLDFAALNDCDGAIMTFHAVGPKWSYVKRGFADRVAHVAEKQQISTEATVGLYWFRYGHDFVRYAKRMIANDRTVNGEFYIAPVYNEMIRENGKVGAWPIKGKMWGLGTPDDLSAFLDAHRTAA